MLRKISILRGKDKDGKPEKIEQIDIQTGEVLSVVGPTGSGKTQLISDIEQYADGESPTHRSILFNDLSADDYAGGQALRYLVAEVSQNMNFVIDMSVEEFLLMHAQVRTIKKPQKVIKDVLAVTNELAGEPVFCTDNLTVLSGGQSRALMVADVALISNAPIVLIDEIENAGINRLNALEFLAGQGKVVLLVSHDPTLILMANRRLVMKNGGMYKIHQTSREEKKVLNSLITVEKDISILRNHFRNGETINKQQDDKEECFLWQGSYYTAH